MAAGVLFVIAYRRTPPALSDGLNLQLPRVGLTRRAVTLGLEVGILSYAGGSLVVVAANELLRGGAPPAMTYNEVPLNPSLTELLAIAFAAVIAAPVLEETIFRGAVQGFVRRALPVVPAVLASGVPWLAGHMVVDNGYDAVRASGLVVSMVVFGLLYDRTASLATVIAAHMAHNSAVFVMVCVDRALGGLVVVAVCTACVFVRIRCWAAALVGATPTGPQPDAAAAAARDDGAPTPGISTAPSNDQTSEGD